LYQEAKEREENHKAFIKYEKVLSELKEIGYLNDEQYMDKSNALKKYLKT
jgi:SOS response regulatory protein OraA/RecX